MLHNVFDRMSIAIVVLLHLLSFIIIITVGDYTHANHRHGAHLHGLRRSKGDAWLAWSIRERYIRGVLL